MRHFHPAFEILELTIIYSRRRNINFTQKFGESSFTEAYETTLKNLVKKALMGFHVIELTIANNYIMWVRL